MTGVYVGYVDHPSRPISDVILKLNY
jgi:hypothetical protein